MNNMANWTYQTDKKHSNYKYFTSVHTEHSSGWIICLATNQSINLKKKKNGNQTKYHFCCSKMELEIINRTKTVPLTPARMATINKTTINNCWRGCRKKGTLLHCGWECSHCGKQCGIFSEN